MNRGLDPGLQSPPLQLTGAVEAFSFCAQRFSIVGLSAFTMAYLNENYLKLQTGYLFPEIARRVREFCEANPDAARRLIRCGIGDVTEPLPPAVIAAIHRAIDDLSARGAFRGYVQAEGPEALREQ